jgi:peptidyl-prolyl cis-trans isomerase D
MLLAIRERVMGVVGWILLGLLGIAFSFFGLNWYFQSDSRTYAVTVNDVDVSVGEHQRTYQRLRSRMQSLMGEAYDPARIDEAALKKNALEQLIREQLLLQEAEAEGFLVSKQLVAAQIDSVDAFKDEGVFSKQKYETALRLQGMSPGEFEWRLSRELTTQQITNGIVQTAQATPAMLDAVYRLQGQQRRFRYLKLPLARYQDQVKPSDEEVQQYYEAHNTEFMTPERIRVQYLELKADELKVSAEVDEADLQALYQEQSERYVTEEERRARHILVQVAADADDETIEAARARATTALERLASGESFEALARELSDDKGSAANGGDLGFFARGMMVPEFESVAFGLDKGARSGIVRSAFGFHIIEVTDIKPEVVRPFAEVRDELVDELLAGQRGDRFYELSDQLSNLAFEQPDTLEGAAHALELEIRTSDWLTRDGGAGIGENAGVVAAAFAEDVLNNGNNSEPVEVTADHLIVLRVQDHERAAALPLDSVRNEVRAKVHAEKARSLARTQGEELLASLRSGTPLDEIAAAESLELQESGLVDRRAVQPERTLVHEAFLMAPPAGEQASVTGLALGSGDYVLIALEEVRDGELSALTDAEREQASRELSRIQGVTEMAALLDDLRSKAKIVIHDQSN